MSVSDEDGRTSPVDLSVAMSTSAGVSAVEQAAAFGVPPERAWADGESAGDGGDPWLSFVLSTFEPDQRPKKTW